MKQSRSSQGRLLFYTRDSGGKHETTPGEYVRIAQSRAKELGLTCTANPQLIDSMIRSDASTSGDLYLDFDVKGNLLSRPGLDALLKRVESDSTVSHVFIPRRDRLARPDNPLDGMQLELNLRSMGVALIFLDRICPPLQRGIRDHLGDLIVSLVDYDNAGKDRRELAEKILFAQLSLAKAGFSTGGRPPYGFRRWLAKATGELVRELQEGERVRMAGHHIVWMPVADDHANMQTIRRILLMLETTPAAQVAARLTSEGVPSPDAGRVRKDNKVYHTVSGVWHATTIVNIARNPLLQAIVAYGRRSMGDQLRFDGDGPRTMTAEDFRLDGKPKVIRNPTATMLTAEAKFLPLVDSARHGKLLQTLDERGGTQRGKPRSRDPNRNPLGGRLFDLNCTWPMYRIPKSDSFGYTCGAYMQSHGAKCDHNQVDGPTLTNVVLDTLRQKLLAPASIQKLKARLQEFAAQEKAVDSSTMELANQEAEARQIEQELTTVKRNMAFADSKEQYQAVAEIYDGLVARQAAVSVEIRKLQTQGDKAVDLDDEVKAALAALDRLPELAAEANDLTAVTAVIGMVNIRVFLGFQPQQLKKRVVNRIRCGSITFGDEQPPIAVYEGPTGRRALQGTTTATVAVGLGGDQNLPGPM